jgi:hypothetical protein
MPSILPLSNNGIERNVYHAGKCPISFHIQKLLDKHAKVVEEMETEFVEVCAQRVIFVPIVPLLLKKLQRK